jgi:uncharacterized membrane protein
MGESPAGEPLPFRPRPDSPAGRLLGAIDRRIGGILLPGWVTPLAIACLALLVIQSFDHRYVWGSISWTLVVTGALAVLFAALYAALAADDQRLAPLRRRPLTALLLFVLAANTLLHVALLVPHLADRDRYSTDAAATTDCAMQQFLHGRSPYANIQMLTCLKSHGLQFWQTTPKRAGTLWSFSTYPTPNQPEAGVGSQTFELLLWQIYRRDLAHEQQDPRYVAAEFETRFNYPAGALYFALASWILGVRDLVVLYLAAALIASILIYRRTAPHLRWATALVLLADTALLLDSSVGATDVVYALLLVLYWHYRERALAAGLILGLAAATRQQAWFFAPFLLYLGYRTGGWADLRMRAGLAVATFLACNAPFIVQSPANWLAGVLGPMADPLFAQGIGLIALAIAFTKGHLGPPLLYAVLEVLALIGAFRFYMRWCLAAPGLAMLLPLMPLALAWRSLHTYFLILPLLATAVLAAGSRRGAGQRETTEEMRLAEAV